MSFYSVFSLHQLPHISILSLIEQSILAVTTCSRAADALSLLRERKGSFDLVISDVHMPDMDGFKLLEHVGLEMDLPVISKLSLLIAVLI